MRDLATDARLRPSLEELFAQLKTDPKQFPLKSGKLKGHRAARLRFAGNQWRCVFRVRETERIVEVQALGPHDAAYEEAERRAMIHQATLCDDIPCMKSLIEDAQSQAEQHFRASFAVLVTAYMAERPHLSPEDISTEAKPYAGQGNRTAVVDLANAAKGGWVHPPFAREVFRILEIPEHSALADAYEALKRAIEGRAEKTLRGRR